MMYRTDLLSTDEDIEIRISLRSNLNSYSWLATLRADAEDAMLMRRLLRTRKNNRNARAFAEKREAA